MLKCLCAALGAGEIILIVACVAIVIGVIAGVVVRKKKGKCACCDECDGSCPHCAEAAKQHSEKK